MKIPYDAIKQVAGSSVSATRPLTGGSISTVLKLELENRTKVVLKYGETHPGMLMAEAEGLAAIAKTNSILVPEVLHVSPEESWLLLEYLEPAGAGKGSSIELAQQIAEMHAHTAGSFGFSTDNFIGRLPQRNRQRETWSAFFVRERLEPQIAIAKESGWWSTELERLFDEKRARIVTLLDEAEATPALLHGDLWSGNILQTTRGPALIDPAVYFGCREADIAFTELFGRQDESFYKHYFELQPTPDGYAHRREIHNLYHLFTHANMFGGGYIASAGRVLEGI